MLRSTVLDQYDKALVKALVKAPVKARGTVRCEALFLSSLIIGMSCVGCMSRVMCAQA